MKECPHCRGEMRHVASATAPHNLCQRCGYYERTTLDPNLTRPRLVPHKRSKRVRVMAGSTS